MNESPIIFCREWAVTVALTAYLAPAYSRPVTAVYGMLQLVSLLEEHPHTPVVLGLRPHEHVADLYRLQPLLAGRYCLSDAAFTGWTTAWRNGWGWSSTGSAPGTLSRIRSHDEWSCGVSDNFQRICRRMTGRRKKTGNPYRHSLT